MKKLIIVTIMASMLLLLNGCASEKPNITMLDAARYIAVHNMDFYSSVGGIAGIEPFEVLGYTQFVFIYSEEEFLANYFPDDTIVAWPSLFTHQMPAALNLWLERNEDFDLEKYSLTYPLTIEDMVENWINVFHFWQSIPAHYLDRIRRHARDKQNQILLSELNIISEAFIVAGIDATEYGLLHPLRAIDGLGGGMYTIIDLLSTLDEDVQQKILPKIPNFMAGYRDMERGFEWRDAIRRQNEESAENTNQ